MKNVVRSGDGPEIAWFRPGMPLGLRIVSFVATAGGAGHSPVAPGTAGSVVAALLFFALGRSAWTIQLVAILLALAVGWWSANVVERFTGRHDDGRIVIDEVIGLWIALFALEPTWLSVGAGFLLFRALDIVKPFPANWIDERLRGGGAVLLDDVVAGLYAHFLLRFGMRLAGLL